MKRQQRNRRASLILLWFAGIFVLVQVLGSLAFDYLVPRVKFAHLHRHINKLAGLDQPWSVIFLGSSRTGTSITDAEASEILHAAQGPGAGEVVNLAVPLGDLLCSDAILEQVLAQGCHPRLVIVELCPEFLNAHNSWLEHYLERQLCWHELPRFASELYQAQLMEKTAEHRLLPWYSYRKGFWNAWADEGERLWHRIRQQQTATYDTTTRRKDWERMLGMGEQTSAAEKEKKTLSGLELIRNGLKDFRIGGQSTEALQRIIDRCRQHQCQLIFLAPPVSSRHRQLYTPSLEAAFLEHIALVTKEHGEFIDARRLLPDELFLDNHHADVEGGVRFTRELMQQYLLPRWQ